MCVKICFEIVFQVPYEGQDFHTHASLFDMIYMKYKYGSWILPAIAYCRYTNSVWLESVWVLPMECV
jgi:hypothetical protein